MLLFKIENKLDTAVNNFMLMPVKLPPGQITVDVLFPGINYMDLSDKDYMESLFGRPPYFIHGIRMNTEKVNIVNTIRLASGQDREAKSVLIPQIDENRRRDGYSEIQLEDFVQISYPNFIMINVIYPGQVLFLSFSILSDERVKQYKTTN